ncbi:MAG: ABC transporter ATP-binding protein [Deltaproteobacteria bacterium]|nr:ABC transporter ATP-binding protein [Nannocystaceae bacterium]
MTRAVRLSAVPDTGERPLSNEPVLRLRGVGKRFGEGDAAVEAVAAVDLDVRPREIVVLLGASGCGKSTLLQMIAGLESASIGSIARPENRTALMFQDAALFPWLSVADNVAFPMKMAKVPRAERNRTVAELLAMVRLTEFADRRPHELSGGMRQRVALARSLAQRAELLLMDEPFAALDAMMRDHLHDELERLWSNAGFAVLFVTHNVREAVRLGDRVLLMSPRPGRVVEEFTIDIPRPRRIDSSEVAALSRKIGNRLAQTEGEGGDHG